jgi:hypothetical protein
VGDEHVEHRAGGVVEQRPVGNAQLLGHVDLHGLDVLAAPHRREQPVGEAQQVQVLRPLLAQEMVDPVDLLLVQHRVDDPVESLGILVRHAERLLVDDARTIGQPVLAEGLRQPAEGGRGDREVVDQLRVTARIETRLGQHVQQAAGVVGAEAAAGEQHALGERLPRPLPTSRHCLGSSPSRASR